VRYATVPEKSREPPGPRGEAFNSVAMLGGEHSAFRVALDRHTPAPGTAGCEEVSGDSKDEPVPSACAREAAAALVLVIYMNSNSQT
jgi:hypothetical protein